MNTQTLRLALALAAGTVLVPLWAQAGELATLDAVQVRPSTGQLAQQAHELRSEIPTLDAVQVRPTVGQIVEQQAGQPVQSRVLTLASVQVRPSAEQRAQRQSRRSANGSAATLASLVGQAVVQLSVPQLQPSPAELEALVSTLNPVVSR